MILWILLGALYLTLFVLLGLATFRKGHYVLFFIGIVFPVGVDHRCAARSHGERPGCRCALTHPPHWPRSRRDPLSAVRRWSHGLFLLIDEPSFTGNVISAH
jgi:hypothetical protein